MSRPLIRYALLVALLGATATGLILAGGDSPHAATGDAATRLGAPGNDTEAAPPEAAPSLPAVLPAPAAQERIQRGRPVSGNPLWAVPLRTLSATRDRPVFSPSRRPPAPAVIAVPAAAPLPVPRPAAPPERPSLTLVGTIVGQGGKDGDKIAIFFNPATKATIRLRLGEAENGWVLRSVAARETVLEKDRQSFTLSLPAPDEQPPALASPQAVGDEL